MMDNYEGRLVGNCNACGGDVLEIQMGGKDDPIYQSKCLREPCKNNRWHCTSDNDFLTYYTRKECHS